MPLYPALADTLVLVPRGKGITATGLHLAFPSIDAKAWSNRLDRLRELGFLECVKTGKYLFYSRITKKGKSK